MSGIIPETGIDWQADAVENASKPAAPFSLSCQYTAHPSDCAARILPDQINAFVSEMLNLAGCFNPEGTWNCDATNNLCLNWTAYRVEVGPGTLTGDVHEIICAAESVGEVGYDTEFMFCVDGVPVKGSLPEPVPPLPLALSHGIRGTWGITVPDRVLDALAIDPYGMQTLNVPNTSPVPITVQVNIRLDCDLTIIEEGGSGAFSFSRFGNSDGTGGVIMDAHTRIRNINGSGQPQVNIKVNETRAFEIPPGGLDMYFGFEGGARPAGSARIDNVGGKVEVYGVYATTFDEL